MRIYILADMEGVSGIQMERQVKADYPEYEDGRRLLMQDINTAVNAAYRAGAKDVVVCDTHGGGGQLRLAEMDHRASYEMPSQYNMMPSLDQSFDGLILLGHHARAGTLNGFLDHTMDASAWLEYRINGEVVGEIGIEAAYAGHFNVPVVAVTGDEAVCQEARDLFGDVACATVKWGIGRNRAKCLSLPEAHKRITAAIETALTSISQYHPYRPALPATVRLTFYRSDMADAYSSPEVERIDARTIQKTVNSLEEIRPW